MARIIISFAALLALAGAARADKANAKAHYQRATAHFAVGEFNEAAAEYQAAFKLKQDPALLYNAAQAYRLAGNHERAVILYRNYLQIYPRSPNAEVVRAHIVKLKEAIAAQQTATSSPPTGTEEPQRSTVEDEKSAAKPIAAAPVVAVTPAPKKGRPSGTGWPSAQGSPEKPAYKKWWVWTIVGVVVAGGAVTAAVLLTQPAPRWSNVDDVGPAGLSVSW